MLIDTHAHVQFPAYPDPNAVLQRTFDAGVGVINIGTQLDTSKWAVELAKKYESKAYAVVGLHPTHTYDNGFEDAAETYERRIETEFDVNAYKKLAQDSKVVGIGECGLDYYRLPENLDQAYIKDQQKKAFLAQIDLALELDKALVIHCRPSKDTNDAYEDCIQIITAVKSISPRLRFEVHSFTGDVDIAKQIIQLGGYIGFNGITTFDKTGRSERVVKQVPVENILLETDAPYLAPVPFRGKQNEPAYVVHIAKKIAEWKGLTFEEVAKISSKNAQVLFSLHI